MDALFISDLHGNLYAGPSYSVPQSIEAFAIDNNVTWININPEYKYKAIAGVIYISGNEFKEKGIDKILYEKGSYPKIVVFEELYCVEFCGIAKKLETKGIPYVIIPRGCLCQTAQSTKHLKKLLGNMVLFNHFIKNAAAIQYLTKKEYIDSGDKWNRRHIIIPNGIKMPDEEKRINDGSGIRGTFIGRIDIRHKGLDLLLEAVSEVEELLVDKGCEISVYGADSIGDKEKLVSLVDQLNVTEIVSVKEPVYGDEKADVLKHTDFFILTSRYEGHPMGLIEALAYGIPSLVTYGSNMGEEIEEADAGWVSNADPTEIKDNIIKLLSDKEELKAKGHNARKLAQSYDWSKIAETMCRCYEEIIK